MATYTCGDAKTYGTIQLGIDAIPGNLLGHGQEHVQVYAKAAGYAEVLDLWFGFSNPSVADYIDVEAMVSHGGLRGQGIVLDISTLIDSGGVWLRTDFTRFHGFCLTGTTSYAGDSIGISCEYRGCYVYDNIIYDLKHSGNQTISAIYLTGTNNDVCARNIYNNQIINVESNPSSRDKQFAIAGNNSFVPVVKDIICNNSIVANSGNVANGIALKYFNNTEIKNNYVGGVSSGYAFSFWGGGGISTFDYNISSDATSQTWGGVGNLINKAAVDQFQCVVLGKEDLHPKMLS